MKFVIGYTWGTDKIVDKKQLCNELSTFNTYNMNVGTKPSALKWPEVSIYHADKGNEPCRIEYAHFKNNKHTFFVINGKNASFIAAVFTIEVS